MSPKKNKTTQAIEEAKRKNPHLSQINWNEIINNDPDVMNDLASGVARVGGKRKAAINYNVGTQKFHAIQNFDYSELPFDKAFTILCRDTPLRTIARKMDVSPAHVYNLKNGSASPTFEVMEKAAAAFNRKPTFFLEYRIGSVLLSIELYLQRNPETSTVWYNKLYAKKGIELS